MGFAPIMAVPPGAPLHKRGILVRRLILFILAIGVGTAACSGANQVGPSPVGSGATINGSIVSEGGSATKHAGTSGGSQTIPGLVVSVAGTTISAPVNNADAFTLTGVPSGTVQLVFAAPSLNTSLSLTGIQAADIVEIGVIISGATVMLDSDRRTRGSETELEGRVEALPPTTLPNTFIAAGRHVTTNADTKFFFRGDETATFADLEVGMRVHVKGQRSDGSLLASLVRIQNPKVDIPVHVNGLVSDFGGTPIDFHFNVGDRLIKGDVNTAFQGNSRFADLANGKRVEVTGELRDGFVYALRIKVNDN